MQVIRTHTHTVLYGDTVGDVASYLQATPKLWSQSDSRAYSGGSWDLGADWASALRMATHGWSEGARKLANVIDVLMPPNAKETRTTYDVAGYFPDVARYTAGDPAHMVRRGRERGHAPVLNLVIAMTASGGINAQNYANFGGAMTNMIDRLEAGGRRIELSVMFPNDLKHTRALVGWRVKRASDHCDLASIAFSIAHPAAYRRLGFGLWEHTEQKNWMYGYGRCVPFTQADAEYMGLEEPLIINAHGFALGACSTPKSAAAFAAKQINQAAGEELVTLTEEN